MAYINDERICGFILINHYYMTIGELADELKISFATVSNLCKSLGVKPITIRERSMEFILKNKHLTQEELAQKLCVTKEAITTYIKELGIEVTTDFKKSQQVKKQNIESFTKPRIHKKAVYNQSGSDLLDKFRGITTTERVQVKASDAFFK